MVLFLAMAVGLGWWAWQQASERPTEARLTVAATIFPLADMVRRVGGEWVQVELIIPPGVSEHSFALTPQQLQTLQAARVIFQIGHGLEDRLTDRLTQAVPTARLVTVDRGVTLRPFNETGEDPHYWLTVPNAQWMAATIAAVLQELDPEHATEYEAKLARYRVELDEVEAELQALAQGAPQKEFMAMHNAWSYLAAHYGFRLVGTYEPVEGQEPSLTDLQRMRELVRQYGLTTFYAEPQKAGSTVAAFMQREFGLKVRTLDPVGGVLGRKSYVELMRFNINELAQGGE